MQATGVGIVEEVLTADDSGLLLVSLDLGSLILLDSTPSPNEISDGDSESPKEGEDCSMNMRVA